MRTGVRIVITRHGFWDAAGNVRDADFSFEQSALGNSGAYRMIIHS